MSKNTFTPVIRSARSFRTRFNSTEQIAAHWSASDPLGALASAAQVPEVEPRATAVEAVVKQLAQHDEKSAAELLGKLPPGLVYDQGVGAYAEHAARRDPAGALAWTATISDAFERAERTARVVERWRT